MRKVFLFMIFSAQIIMASVPSTRGQVHPTPPGLHRADKLANAPLEPPAPPVRKPLNPAKLHEEAGELAKLSAVIPAQIEQVNQGQIPKDLGDRLKRIEKLAKQLRTEILP